MQQKYASKGFTIVSVSPDEDKKQAGAFAKEVKATFPVVHDVKYSVFEKYGVEALPANIVLDRKGKVVAAIEGADIAALDRAVNKALASK